MKIIRNGKIVRLAAGGEVRAGRAGACLAGGGVNLAKLKRIKVNQRVLRYSFCQNIDSLAKTGISIFLASQPVNTWKNIPCKKHQQRQACPDSTAILLKLTFAKKSSNRHFLGLSGLALINYVEYRNTL